jgi:hypothetical protein
MSMFDYRMTEEVLAEVLEERGRQHEKWGEQNHGDGTGGTPIAHVLRTLCDASFKQGHGTWAHILGEEFAEALDERQPASLRKELVQVAAVAVAWVEAIDRRQRGAIEKAEGGR